MRGRLSRVVILLPVLSRLATTARGIRHMLSPYCSCRNGDLLPRIIVL